MIDKHCGTCRNLIETKESGDVICAEFTKSFPTCTVNPALSQGCVYWKPTCKNCRGCTNESKDER